MPEWDGRQSDQGRDGPDSFDSARWSEERSAERYSNGTEEQATQDGHEYSRRPAGEGRWVSEGGVMRWEAEQGGAEDEAEAAKEGSSRWAADDIDLPPGAPDTLRVRATRAWLLRQRAAEAEALGYLLLERRQQQTAHQGDEAGRRALASDQPEGPLELALAEHQAAIQEFEQLVEAMDEIRAHTGPAHLLVEFFLRLNERLAELAAEPAAPAGFAAALLLAPVEDEEAAEPGASPATPRAQAEWQGRAEAVLHARKRVERVTASDPED